MSTPPFIPRADAEFKAWASGFVKGIHELAHAYGLSPSDGQALMRCYNEFDAAYQLTKHESTRTKITVREKDQARGSLEGFCRGYAAQIRANLGVSDAAKIAIGVRPRNLSRQRRDVPATSPTLNFQYAVPGYDVLHFGDSINKGKAKPFGAERLELWAAYQPIGSKPGKGQLPQSGAQFIGAFRKNPISAAHHADATLRPTYWARWAGFHDDVGPWSLACSVGLRLGASKSKAKHATKAKQAKADADDAESTTESAGDHNLKFAA